MDRSYDPAPGERYAHLWGYQDTRFEFCGPRTVRVTGDRYPLAGPPLPKFIPFVEDVFGMEFGPDHMHEPAPLPPLPPPVRNDAFLAALKVAHSADDDARLVHSHGQLSVDEIYRILVGGIPDRVVDLVVFPESEGEVVELVELADRHGVVLIPYGGGTNVSGALLCPAGETRMVVSVDMRRMNRILEVDTDNGWAVVEAGITGKDLEHQLEERGLTTGHVPDSVELSTLGGWIATNASGMKKNRYGNIEDIVLDATLVSARGEVRTLPVNPRHSVGVQPRALLFGSEGSLGIITRATVQVRALPEVREFESFVFPEFAAGIRFLKAVQDSGARPASIRLVNNQEFRLGQALSAKPSALKKLKSRLLERYVVGVKGFDPMKMVACTAVMEGTVDEVRHQQRTLGALLKAAGGLAGGAEGGKRGYRTTFAIAYIRDFMNKLGILGETFETSAPWGSIEGITSAVAAELKVLCERHGVPGRPYLSYRISQVYPAGVCIYFTMAFSGRGMDRPEHTYAAMEKRLREVILEHGGSLSHHHGVGKVRRDFLTRVHSDGGLAALRAVKQALDPNDVFGAANNVFGE